MSKMASSRMCLVHRLEWLEELEMKGYLFSFSMHPLPWQAWAFSQQDILRLSIRTQ